MGWGGDHTAWAFQMPALAAEFDVNARGDVEEFTRFILPWLLCRKTFADCPDFVEAWIQRAVEYPFKTSLVGLSRQAEAIRSHDTGARLPDLRVPTLITTGIEDIL